MTAPRMTEPDAPVTVEQACERIQRWMDDEHRELSPGEVGAELVYDDVSIVLRAARLAALASAPAGDGDWQDMDKAPRDGSIVEVRSAFKGNPAVFLAAYIRPTGLVAHHWVPVKGQAVGALPWKDSEIEAWRWPAALARPRAAVGERYLVWSNEHQAWWGPEHRGYTRHIERAGRYDRAEAMSIAGTRDGGWHVRKGNPDEIAIPERDAVEQYAAITAALALQSPPAKVEG